jgi:hypothetical protein
MIQSQPIQGKLNRVASLALGENKGFISLPTLLLFLITALLPDDSLSSYSISFLHCLCLGTAFLI